MLAAAILALAALPYWMGALVPVAGRLLQISIGSYEREGYAKFVLRKTAYEDGSVRVTAVEVRGDTPVLWAWRWIRGAERVVEAKGWVVHVKPSPASAPDTGGSGGIAALHDQLVGIAAGLRHWLPHAVISNGSVDWPGGGFGLGRAEWNGDALIIGGLAWEAGKAQGRLEFPAAGPIRIHADEPDRGWKAALTWNGPHVEGEASAWGQPVGISAEYGPQGWLPTQAKAVAENWRLSAKQAGLGAAYGIMEGGGEADWKAGVFSIAVHAKADPLAKGAPPLRINAKVEGDRHRWSVQALDIETPSARAVLDQAVSFGYGPRPAFARAALEVSADLSAIPLLQAKGRVSGHVVLTGDVGGNLPTATVELTAKEAAWGKVPAGNYAISGVCDLQRRSFSQLKVDATWPGSALAPWLPAGAKADRMIAAVTFDGAWSALNHRGTARIEGVSIPSVRADGATLAWSGRGLEIDSFEARMSAGATTLSAAGSANADGARLSDLRFAPGGKEALRLVAPAELRWTPQWSLSAASFRGGAAAIDGGFSGEGFSARLTRIPVVWLRSVLVRPGPDFEISSANILAHWNGGRLVFAAQAAVQVQVGDRTAEASLRADSDGNRIHLKECSVVWEGDTVARADGEFPFSWNSAGLHWEGDPDGPIRLSARIEPASPFWSALAARAGVTVTRPEATVEMGGSLRRPSGKMHVAVFRLEQAPNRTGWKLPTLDRLIVEAHADRGSITLDNLGGNILGQPISASGRMPMGDAAWLGLWQKRGAAPWEKAEGRLSVADADVASLGPFLPNLLAPRGSWRLKLDVKNGAWNGALHLEGLALRPVDPIGLVQNITGDVVGSGRTLSTAGFSAEIGGSKLTLDGRVEMNPGSMPRYSLALHGAAIPLVRKANLLVRSDLDLHAQTEGEETRISGKIEIRDGLLLGNLSDLLPSGMAGGARPPPYFSITAVPFRGWGLDVAVSADRTLRAQTPLFGGKGSAQFRLSGTLGDPRAIGQLRIDQGRISLPFAGFEVQFGTVRLNAEDPFHPQVNVQANARRNDYDVRMLATGDADNPTLTFTSNPALPSDQILALVMAGQSPQTGGIIGAGQSQVQDLGAFVGKSLFAGLSGQPSADRLSFTTGQELSVSGKPTFTVEYLLAPKWRLVGEYDIFDDYNGGIKWRVYSKGGDH